MELLLCAKHCSRPWRYKREQKQTQSPALMQHLVWQTDTEHIITLVQVSFITHEQGGGPEPLMLSIKLPSHFYWQEKRGSAIALSQESQSLHCHLHFIPVYFSWYKRPSPSGDSTNLNPNLFKWGTTAPTLIYNSSNPSDAPSRVPSPLLLKSE